MLCWHTSTLEQQSLCPSHRRKRGLPIGVKGYSIRGHQASHTALITLLLLLLVAAVSVDAQSRKSGRSEQQGVNAVHAVSAPPTVERRAALVIGNSPGPGRGATSASARGTTAPGRGAPPARGAA